jgi:hypothetical protein
MDNSSINLDYGVETESLLKFVLDELDDTSIDAIEVDRKIDQPRGLASEPITLAVTITASSVLIVHVTRLIERWLETRRQEQAGILLIEAFKISNEAGQALKELGIKHTDVSIAYPLSQQKSKDK